MRQYFESWFLLFIGASLMQTYSSPCYFLLWCIQEVWKTKRGWTEPKEKRQWEYWFFFFHILWMWENREQLWCRSELAEFYYRVTKAEGETLGTVEGEWEGEVERTMKSNGDECGHIVSSNSSWEIASDASCSPRSFPTQGLPVR